MGRNVGKPEIHQRNSPKQGSSYASIINNAGEASSPAENTYVQSQKTRWPRDPFEVEELLHQLLPKPLQVINT